MQYYCDSSETFSASSMSGIAGRVCEDAGAGAATKSLAKAFPSASAGRCLYNCQSVKRSAYARKQEKRGFYAREFVAETKSSLVIAVAEGFVAPDFAAAEVPVFVRRK